MTRKSQIDQAIDKLDTDIQQLQSAREALRHVRDEIAKSKKKTATKPRPVAKAAGE